MTPPRIIGFRLVPPRHDRGGQATTLAILTVEHAFWIIGGLRLSHSAVDGSYFIRGPERLAGSRDRLSIRSGPERDALVAAAARMLTGATERPTAGTPVATAPDHLETSAQ